MESRIYPVALEHAATSAETLRLYRAWLTVFPQQSDEPWVPVGNLGPMLMLGHYKPAAPRFLPDWMMQHVKLTEPQYRALLAFVQAETQQVTLFKQPEKALPPARPEMRGLDEAIDVMLNYYCLREQDKLSLETIRGKATAGGALITEGFEGMTEAMLYLYNPKVRVADPRYLGTDHDLARIADTCGQGSNTAALKNPDSKETIYFLSGKQKNEILRDSLSNSARLSKLTIKIELVLAPMTMITTVVTERKANAQKVAGQKADGVRMSDEDTSKQDIVLDVDVLEKLDVRGVEVSPGELFRWFLHQGIKSGASDLHFEQVGSKARVRLRIDGVLRILREIPEEQMRSMMAVVRSGEIPGFVTNAFDAQDARSSVRAGDTVVNIRASMKPHFKNGYQVLVIRLLAKKGVLQLDKLGIPDLDKKILRRAFSRPSGLILVTGPTGSGKTTTLYACLSEVNTEDVRITTMEDPVEIELAGATQSQVDNKRDVTFGKLLVAALRQDPDIILVGEIRDKETARKALEAACTGHLVFATLHANSEVEAVGRIADLVDDEKQLPVLAKALILLQSQRLIPKLCPKCKIEIPVVDAKTDAIFANRKIDVSKIYAPKPEGCDHCYHGYSGRTAIMSLLPVTLAIAEAIATGANAFQVRKLADEAGFTSLFDQALYRVRDGITSMQAASDWDDAWAGFNFKE